NYYSIRYNFRLCAIGLVLLLVSACDNKDTEKVSVKELFEINLASIHQDSISLREFADIKARVFVFLSPDCPISQRYAPVLNRLHNLFDRQGILFYGVIPGPLVEYETKDHFIKDHQLNFPVLIDTYYSLTNLINAKVTPQAIVVDQNGKISYSGRIDNWFISRGKKRNVVTDDNLKNAIHALIHDQPVTTPRTEAIGCYIFPLIED
ncbi:MAG TPA: redoxin domain-containing protein, partial [Flavobacteriales bacterium]|nr:redoxin domain-containing protein [Flavobacteriales bacterium]